MGSLMDLVAGESREILLALAVDDIDGLSDPDRFTAHLSLGGGLDPTWLDLFSEAVRSVTGETSRRTSSTRGPSSACPATAASGSWSTSARSGSRPSPRARGPAGALAGRWIDLLEEELGLLPREEKPWIRDLAARIVHFARSATSADDVIFAWSF